MQNIILYIDVHPLREGKVEVDGFIMAAMAARGCPRMVRMVTTWKWNHWMLNVGATHLLSKFSVLNLQHGFGMVLASVVILFTSISLCQNDLLAEFHWCVPVYQAKQLVPTW